MELRQIKLYEVQLVRCSCRAAGSITRRRALGTASSAHPQRPEGPEPWHPRDQPRSALAGRGTVKPLPLPRASTPGPRGPAPPPRLGGLLLPLPGPHQRCHGGPWAPQRSPCPSVLREGSSEGLRPLEELRALQEQCWKCRGAARSPAVQPRQAALLSRCLRPCAPRRPGESSAALGLTPGQIHRLSWNKHSPFQSERSLSIK